MRTFILVKRDDAGNIVDLAGPCTEKDSKEFKKEKDLELIDELLFKTLHPEDYKQLLLKDLTPAVYAWIDQLYNNKLELLLENNAIVADQFVIQISLAEIHVMFHCTCSALEAANLVLHLRFNVFEDITISVTEIPLSLSICCEN